MGMAVEPIISNDMQSAIKDTVKNDEITKTVSVDEIDISDDVQTSHAGNNTSEIKINETESLNSEDQSICREDENLEKVEQTINNVEASEDVPDEHFAQDDVVPDPQLERASKRKNVRKNRSKKMVLQKEKVVRSPLVIANIDTPEDSSKKLYSAVCKPSEPASPVQVVPLKTKTEKAKEEKLSSSVVENTIVQPPPQQQHQKSPQPDQWESVPLAIVSKPSGWEQNSSKRKNRKKRNNNIVHFEDEITTPEVVPEKIESKKVERVEAVKEEKQIPIPAVETETVKEDDEEKEEEKKKNKKRKKRHTSEETDVGSHRVIISDDLVEIRLTRPVRRAEEILTPPQLQRASLSGHLDFVLISELGCGMNKGSMNYDRLYKGKYIPPERRDGIPLEEEQEEMKDEDAEDISEVITILPKEDVDIDLD